jgi:signal transduction histidine kinase
VQEPLALAKWRGQAMVIALIGAGAAAGFAVLFGIIGWQFRRQAEDNARLAENAVALRASEARVSDFAQMSSDWLWETDTAMRFTFVSDCTMTRTMDVTRQLGRTPWQLFGGDPAGARWEPVRSAVQARRPFRDFRDGETDPTGAHHFVSINGMPMFDASGAFAGYRGTGREITADVAAARELELAKERAEAASRAKSEFLANMSHELRTPLNAVIGFSELIRDQAANSGNATHAEFASEINYAGHHLLDMINDVLDLSKIEAGRYVLADEPVDVGMVVRACIGMLRLRAKSGGVRIDNRLDCMLYALRGDARALQQVLLNLLGNAVKFTPSGGVVSLWMEDDDNGATLVVRDTGIGIDAAVLRSLGQPFHQADASISRKYGGSGLGLAISRKLLALHGATLSMESEQGVGTTVRVGFPSERVLLVTPAERASVAPA